MLSKTVCRRWFSASPSQGWIPCQSWSPANVMSAKPQPTNSRLMRKWPREEFVHQFHPCVLSGERQRLPTCEASHHQGHSRDCYGIYQKSCHAEVTCKASAGAVCLGHTPALFVEAIQHNWVNTSQGHMDRGRMASEADQ